MPSNTKKYFKFETEDLKNWSKAEMLSHSCSGAHSFCIDSRKAQADSIFVALQGLHNDGHFFLEPAYRAGAKIFIVNPYDERTHKAVDELATHKDISILKVQNSIKALQNIAHNWRHCLSGKVLAVSGSSGKTSTKNFISQILSNQNTQNVPHKKMQVRVSPLSYNNHLGVPLSLLQTEQDDDLVVLELGINHDQEMTSLCKIASPDSMLLTNVGSAHLGNFGTFKKLEEEKGEIFSNINPKSICFFNLSNPSTKNMFLKYKKKCNAFTFSYKFYNSKNNFELSKDDNIQKHISIEVVDETLCELKLNIYIGTKKFENINAPLVGQHQAGNLAAAVAVAFSMGVDANNIIKRLPQIKSTWGRMQILKHKTTTLLFDAYNASPDSMDRALQTFIKISSEKQKDAPSATSTKSLRTSIVGEMLELGSFSQKAHFDLGKLMAQYFDKILFVSKNKEISDTFKKGLQSGNYSGDLFLASSVEDKNLEKLKKTFLSNPFLFIKGSRYHRLEKLLQNWNVTIN